MRSSRGTGTEPCGFFATTESADLGGIRRWAIVRGAYLAFPLGDNENEETSPQLRVVRALLG
jgi:hypothetical protein